MTTSLYCRHYEGDPEQVRALYEPMLSWCLATPGVACSAHAEVMWNQSEYVAPRLFVMPALTLENDGGPTIAMLVNSDAFVNIVCWHTHMPLEFLWDDCCQHKRRVLSVRGAAA